MDTLYEGYLWSGVMMYYIKDNSGNRWKIREAMSVKCAVNAIANARVTGSVGSKSILDETYVGGSIKVLADVVRVHSDLTEQKPYEQLR